MKTIHKYLYRIPKGFEANKNRLFFSILALLGFILSYISNDKFIGMKLFSCLIWLVIILELIADSLHKNNITIIVIIRLISLVIAFTALLFLITIIGSGSW